eukprot:8402493-Pyramimonas_sp.AAC.1
MKPPGKTDPICNTKTVKRPSAPALGHGARWRVCAATQMDKELAWAPRFMKATIDHIKPTGSATLLGLRDEPHPGRQRPHHGGRRPDSPRVLQHGGHA